ncbi:DUF1275 domain-containing protein [Alloscardovia theropitheci]|uniref:DUF1275 domain-containing protein n=1 Tax=Alloscardovia theropitheci TaxID=2496842 RepID=A0A4R0R1N2_9BIFI|nr:YoaK family protein [Alloscardovia theropitheci]TCD55066.1 DUF1275 domain-containing protein [Alloscardovia theropitheci]
MPQDTRFAAICMGFFGGALDVFCHIRFHALLATQTGNIVLLIADLKPDNLYDTVIKLLSIVFFSVGFVSGIYFKAHARTAYWRTYLILPTVISGAILPLVSHNAFIWVPILGWGTGLLMLTFTGVHIENHAVTYMMTSGNYRKMLGAWYHYSLEGKKDGDTKRQAINYTIVVVSFVIGALSASLCERYIGDFTMSVISVSLLLVVIYYTYIVHRDHLEKTNV